MRNTAIAFILTQTCSPRLSNASVVTITHGKSISFLMQRFPCNLNVLLWSFTKPLFFIWCNQNFYRQSEVDDAFLSLYPKHTTLTFSSFSFRTRHGRSSIYGLFSRLYHTCYASDMEDILLKTFQRLVLQLPAWCLVPHFTRFLLLIP